MEEDGVEFESFGVSDFDLDSALNPGQYRKRATKHQQIYGVWADDSDEEVQRPSFGGKSFGNVNFVSGGIKQSGGSKPDEEEKKDNEDDEEQVLRAMAYKKYQSKEKLKNKNRGGGMQEIAGLRSGFGNNNEKGFGSWEKHTKGIGQKLLLQMGYQPGKGLGKSLQGISAPVEAKKRPGKGAIGMYGSERTKASLKHFPQQPTDEEEEKQFRDKLQQWKRKPGEDDKRKKKMNYVYKSVDDVKADGSYRKLAGIYANSGSGCNDKVIDMTGPQQRVLAGYQSLQHPSMHAESSTTDTSKMTPQKSAFELSALLYNIDILIDMSEQEIITNDRNLQHHNDMILSNGHQEETLDKTIDSEKRQIRALEEINQLIDDFDSNNTTIEKAEETFKLLQHGFYEEYKMFGLADLAVPVVYPLVKEYLKNWQCLKESSEQIKLFKNWKDILEENLTMNDITRHKDGQLSDCYHRMVWEIWMPFVRQAVTNDWSARDSDAMIEFIENWMVVVPQWVTNNILEQLVLPRLQTEVDDWNPLTDTMPIHSWLHPWLPLMGERLEPLYAPIRQKLSNALVCWHPSDQSAKLILKPWIEVFSKGTMQAFIVKNILPKLASVIQDFVINPHQQQLDPWHWVMAWRDFLPLKSLVEVLDKHFFPRWIQVLCSWLNSTPDFEEVSKWYRGWKSMFPEDLLNDPIIKGHLSRALELLSRAVSQPPQQRQNFAPTPPEVNHMPAMMRPMPPVNMNPHQPFFPQGNMNMPSNYESNMRYNNPMDRGVASASLRNSASGSMNFKDLIAIKAEENNLLFVPVPNRFYEGKQVYRFGRLLIHISRTVVLFLNGNRWEPTSLSNLIAHAF